MVEQVAELFSAMMFTMIRLMNIHQQMMIETAI